MLRPRGVEGLSLLWRTLLQMWRKVWRVWSSLPHHHPCCRSWAGWGCGTLTPVHPAEPGHRAWTQSLDTALLQQDHPWRLDPPWAAPASAKQDLQSCSAAECPHCCTILSLQALGARTGDMELPKCWLAPWMSSKRQRKCESRSRVEEREKTSIQHIWLWKQNYLPGL